MPNKRQLHPEREAFLALSRQGLRLAMANLLQHRRRLYVAMAGIGVAILLLLLQLAFLQGVRIQATRLFDAFQFDLAVVPATYQFLYSGGSFERVRLTQAMADKAVTGQFHLNIGVSRWSDEDSKQRSSILLIGLDQSARFISDRRLRENLLALQGGRAVLVDRFSAASYGPLELGRQARISGQPVHVAGLFELGLFFYADGSAMLRNPDFARLSGANSQQTSIGLLQIAPSARPDAVAQRLNQILPPDVRIMTKADLIAQERAYFVGTKPIGVMLHVSMLIAFLVGATILFQVLSAEILQRAREFAVLKAMGFAPAFVFGVGVAEILLLAFAAFVPALLIAGAILGIIEAAIHLPTGLSPAIAFETLIIVLLMAVCAGISTLRRIAQADPAALFK